MSTGELPCYTIIHVPNDADLPNESQLKEKFEKGSDKEKTDALKKLIYMIQNGEKVNQGMLMYVIRFLLPSSDHTLKKTLLIFWEVVPKTNAQGKLLQEMILVCDAYRKDLQHPNEFVRGSTLRFLCKLKEPELLEPLMPSIIGCLEHRHSYVRRNAVCAIFTIYRNFEFLIPDAPELVSNFLEGEQDASCKRNAFMMLLHVDQARALDYLSGCIDQVAQFGDILQLIIVELIYKVCHANPAERSRFIRCVYNLLQSSSAAVRYEAAGTLVTLSAAPAAIKAAASAYIDLIVKESDNNVKLIVLDRLMDLRQTPSNERVLQELVMDILRVLSSPGLDVRQKTLSLALDLVSSRNVEDMVMFLKKEIAKSTTAPAEEAGKYRQALVKTLHAATIKFPDVAPSIVPVLMEFLSDDNETAAQYVLLFVREAVHKLPHLKETILHSLQEGLPSIRKPKVFMAALWILGTYCETDAAVLSVLRLIKASLGELPIVESEMRLLEGEEPINEDTSEKKSVPKQLVTADGTYATQSALSVSSKVVNKEKPPLRQFLLDGDFFLGASLATVLNKLAEQFTKNNDGRSSLTQLFSRIFLSFCFQANSQRSNRFRAECMFILACIINLGKSGLAKNNVTEDDLDRMGTTIKLLAQGCSELDDVFIDKSKDSLELMLASRQQDKTDEISTKKKNIVEVDKTIMFTQLSARADASIGENLFDLSLSQALGTAPKTQRFDFSSSKLGKVIQLAGFSDPVYAEAYVNVNQYDIVLDVLIVNQTADTLQNVSLELSTVGDLKLVDKPTPITLAAGDFANIKATVKVASTENGVIFSTISYDVRGSTSDRNCVYLQDIKIDIMDYIVPGNVTDAEFRQMWFDFEWENKVTVNTPITDLREFLHYLSTVTNMKVLTGDAAIEGDCGFLAANLCAHSIFGEDALANVSIEKASPLDEGSPIVGHIRIRAKSQGMALTLGDKVRFVLQTESKYVNRSDPNMLTDQRRATGPTGGGGVLVLLSKLY
ncbi:unnamed protein product [Heligmosomoides polygyrus]|uniref:Coatomer subunit beta n=1 Tax=Heligmosomoides polygyrus TaxID=6339 RepID=A0A183GHF8_HELPZ|nr:unnamed protein product [Heligmosomoides polygyrus]